MVVHILVDVTMSEYIFIPGILCIVVVDDA